MKRSPRYLVRRCIDAGHRRLQRPWAHVVPHLVTDRALLRATGERDLQALWRRLADQPFFLSPARRREHVLRFGEAFPAERETVLESARRVLRHQFDLLGSGPMQLGEKLPWDTDFKTGRRWSLQYSPDIEYSELDRPTDVKVPWELSRCQHFVRLGQAYWLSDDERFAREFNDQVSDWIACNPYAYGINWACAMDVALRAVSWIWGFYFFAESDACRDASFRSRFLRSLYLHGEYVATHLERGHINGNHYLCDGVGLVFLGTFFRATPNGRRWLQLGRQIVLAEVVAQTTADGVDFEQSTAYHRLVLEAFITAYRLLQLHGDTIPAHAWDRLRRMHDYVEAYTKPDGRAPLIGDADDGRIQILGMQPINDHRYLLSTGAVLFDEPGFKARASRFWSESFWLLGPDALDRFTSLPTVTPSETSRAFPDGGFYILRNRHAHIVIDCGEVGMRGIGGHGHNDILSFELFLDGTNVITDCGAYLYTASREWRNRFRGTAFHNTVQIDDEELNRFVGPDMLWQLLYDAVPADAALERGAVADRFIGSHRGFERLPDSVRVTREIVLEHDEPRVLIRDTLTGHATHRVCWRFHVDPDVAAEMTGRDVKLSAGGRDFWLLSDPALQGFSLTLRPGWVSPSYGVKVPTTTVVLEGAAQLPLTTSFLFAAHTATGDRGRLFTLSSKA